MSNLFTNRGCRCRPYNVSVKRSSCAILCPLGKISLFAVTIATTDSTQGNTFGRAGLVAAKLADEPFLEPVAGLEALCLKDFERDQVVGRDVGRGISWGVWSRFGYGVGSSVCSGSSEAGAKQHGSCGEVADDEGSMHFEICVG
jgi:hypothetical protein